MTTKFCTKCGETKPADRVHWYFTKDKPTSGPCKQCRKRDALDRHHRDPETGKARMKKWRDENPEKAKECAKQWREANSDRAKEISRRNYLENREARIEYERERRRIGIAKEQARARVAADPEKYIRKRRQQRLNMSRSDKDKANAWMRQYRRDNPEQFRKYESARYENDPHRRVSASLSSAVIGHLSNSGARKSSLRRHIVGWTLQELVAHLEVLFEEGMTWGNYGEWHIDHIIPKSAVNVQSQDDPAFRWLWALDNLAPLWAKDNLEKHARTDWTLPAHYKNPKLRELYENRDEILLLFG